jgi:uncharacterized membrane protein YidH (DUF202 family)
MWQLMLTVVPLGLAAAFTPMLLAVQIMIVSQPPWGRRALAFGAGGLAAFALVSILFLSGFAGLRPILDLWGEAERWAGAGLRLALGALALVAGGVLLRTHPRNRNNTDQQIRRRLQEGSLHMFFVLAFALGIKDVSSFAVLLPALHDIVFSGLGLVQQGLALMVLWILALLPLWVPPVLARYAGPGGQRLLAAIYDFTLRHELALVGGMLVAVGLYLLLTGVGLAPW